MWECSVHAHSHTDQPRSLKTPNRAGLWPCKQEVLQACRAHWSSSLKGDSNTDCWLPEVTDGHLQRRAIQNAADPTADATEHIFCAECHVRCEDKCAEEKEKQRSKIIVVHAFSGFTGVQETRCSYRTEE